MFRGLKGGSPEKGRAAYVCGGREGKAAAVGW